eukprot:scaffold103223_cov19-Tisochrysis_lutea.AAC.1
MHLTTTRILAVPHQNSQLLASKDTRAVSPTRGIPDHALSGRYTLNLSLCFLAQANWCSTPTTVQYPPPSKQGEGASSPGVSKMEGGSSGAQDLRLKAGQATSQELA